MARSIRAHGPIATRHAEHGKSAGAYVALHESQSELSYLQGIIKDWVLKPRQPLHPGEEIKTEEGIEFLLEARLRDTA
jgi:hypothetical protein